MWQCSGHSQAGNLHLSDLGPAQVLAAIQCLSQILPLLASILIDMVLCRIASENSLLKCEDVMWWEAGQMPRPKWLEEEEDHLAADVATAGRGGWRSRWGRCWALRVSSVIDCWLSTLFQEGSYFWCGGQILWRWWDWGLRYIKKASWLSKMPIEYGLKCVLFMILLRAPGT